MSRIKDPQITLVGFVKQVGEPSSPRRMVVVSLPPQIVPKLVERTLLVNLPDEEQLNDVRSINLEDGSRHLFPEIRCYLKLRVFDDKPVVNDCQDRQRDPQEVHTGVVKPTFNSNHIIIVVEFPAENLSPTEGFLATTLIVNVPSNAEDEVVDCYLKYRVIDANDRRAHLPAQRHHSTV